MISKREFVSIVRDTKNISGIYNYCDWWCEKCQFTQRCSNFSLSTLCEKEYENEKPEEKILHSIEFAFKMVRDLLSDEFNDSDIDIPKNEKVTEVQHVLLLTSWKYLLLVSDWFKKNQINLGEAIAADVMMAMATNENIAPRIFIGDIELVSRYSSLIHVKLSRALMDNIDSIDDDEVDNADRQGSAKVAILAIDRSLEVWLKISVKLPMVSVMVRCLQDLLRQIELRFPRARDFLRPGFDAVK